MEDRTRKMKWRREDEDGDTEKHTNTISEPKVTNFIQKYHVSFFLTLVFLIAKEGSFGEASFGGSYFHKGAVTPASEVSFVFSKSVITD